MSGTASLQELFDVFRRLRGDYENRKRRVADLRASLAEEEDDLSRDEDQAVSEAHARACFVDGVLTALNWSISTNGDGTGDLVPEAPVRSAVSGRIRFLDYLGLERDTTRPLVVVEVKRPGSPLPEVVGTSQSKVSCTPATAICEGLRGRELNGKWSEWLETLCDYFKSLVERGCCPPKRVVLTNGEWWIIFRDPEAAFVRGSCEPRDLVIVEWDEDPWEQARKIWDLEHQHLLDRAPALEPGSVPSHITLEEIDLAMRGVRLHYLEKQLTYKCTPEIRVAPVVFLRSVTGAWLRVESPPEDYEIPVAAEKFAEHLGQVRELSDNLLARVGRALGGDLEAVSFEEVYDVEKFARMDLVGRLPSTGGSPCQDFVLITGANAHFLRGEPSVADCPFHDWRHCRDQGVAGDDGPIEETSTKLRCFFNSGRDHHCAHRDVQTAKRQQVARQGPRPVDESRRQERITFCHIFGFERWLCCRTCAFEQICTARRVFNIPCST